MATPRTNKPEVTVPAAANGNAAMVEYKTPDISQFADWSVEQTGFAPYFEPEPGAYFVALIAKADMKDPNFLRYLFQASKMEVKCRRGKKDPNADSDPALDTRPIVIVKPGGFFSLSLFFSMVENLNTYILYQAKTGEPVEVLVRFVDKVRTNNNRTVWNVEMRIPNALQPKMNAFRAELNAEGGEDGVPMLPPVPKGGEVKEIVS